MSRRPMTKAQVDNLARDLIHLWGATAIWCGIDGARRDHCEEWAEILGRQWDAQTASRVQARLYELAESFSRRYERHPGE